MIQSLTSALNGTDNSRGETVGNVLNLLLSIGAGYLSGGATVDFKDALKKGYLEQIRDLKKEFQLLVNKKLGLVDDKFSLGKDKKKNEEALNAASGNKRVVFFIDDLDRLNPGKAVELLEVLKNFLDCKNCVFVLAIDYDVVWRGVAAKYGNVVGDDPKEVQKKGRDFFDKIIQVPFKMPVASYKVEKYIETCLNEINVPVYDKDIETYMELVKASVGTNPRSLKRIINSLALLVKVIGSERLDEIKGYKLLFATLCMQHAYEKLYNYLVRNSKNLEYDQLDLISSGSLEEISRQIGDLDIDNEDFGDIQAFMSVFINKAMDLNNSGTIETTGDNSEMEYLKEILKMSAITAGTSDDNERPKRTVISATRETVRHTRWSDEQKEHVLSLIDEAIIKYKDKISIDYSNTKNYGRALYRRNIGWFIEVAFLDEKKNYIEVSLIPNNVDVWERRGISDICKERGINKGLKNLKNRGISYKYRADDKDDTDKDKDLITLTQACVEDVFS